MKLFLNLQIIFYEYTNKVSPNNFDDKYQVLHKFNELK